MKSQTSLAKFDDRDLEEYKIREVENLIGYSAKVIKNSQVPVMSRAGKEALELAQKILEKRYSSKRELQKDLEALERLVDYCVHFD